MRVEVTPPADAAPSRPATDPAAVSLDRSEARNGGAGPRHAGTFFARLPAALWLVALLAALVHIAPFWRAQASARDGWTFTGNLTVSPDYMQYRVWERQTQREGPLVTNRFTTEPNRAHLPVVFYWAVGKVARWIGAKPEYVFAYAGSLFAALLALLVFATVRQFMPEPRHAWWVFLAIFLGGGLGAHLKIFVELPVVRDIGAVDRFITGPLRSWPVFEDYRSHYIVRTLLDSHFLLIWLVALAAVVALYFALARPSLWRAALTAALFVAITVLHVYEGVTLVAIAGAVALCCWGLPEQRRAALAMFAICTAAVAVCYAALGVIFARSGLPLPDWHAINILFATLAIAYPIAWVLIAWGLGDYWRRAKLPERFLVGWALGCTVITLSGPFYPYPDRGTLTMPVPLYLIAGAIFFARFPRVSVRQAVLAVALLGATPLWLAARTWRNTGFRDDAPHLFINGAHRNTLATLAARADTSDILLAEPADLLWLAPEFPGRLHVGHFFLTVRYDQKLDSLQAALGDPARLPALLEASGARFVFVNAARDPARLQGMAGLSAVARESVGWLFERGEATEPGLRGSR